MPETTTTTQKAPFTVQMDAGLRAQLDAAREREAGEFGYSISRSEFVCRIVAEHLKGKKSAKRRGRKAAARS